jgi:hypothetical protein
MRERLPNINTGQNAYLKHYLNQRWAEQITYLKHYRTSTLNKKKYLNHQQHPALKSTCEKALLQFQH